MFRMMYMKSMVIVVHFYCLGLIATLNYDELESLGISCPPKDTCLRRIRGIGYWDETCECKDSCSRRGTCCIDSPYLDSVSSLTKETCIPIPSRCIYTKGMWAVTKCSPQWNGSRKVINLCEGDPTKTGNVMTLIPASNPKSGVTYLNHFCAVCNDDDLHAVLWNVTIHRLYSSIPKDICKDKGHHDLHYERDTAEWGFRETCFSEDWPVFVPVRIEIGMPPFQPNYCNVDVIKSCAEDWVGNSIRKKCETYTAVIKIPRQQSKAVYYRNAHCAICNHVKNFTLSSCYQFRARTLGVVCPSPDPGITETLSHRIENASLVLKPNGEV